MNLTEERLANAASNGPLNMAARNALGLPELSSTTSSSAVVAAPPPPVVEEVPRLTQEDRESLQLIATAAQDARCVTEQMQLITAAAAQDVRRVTEQMPELRSELTAATTDARGLAGSLVEIKTLWQEIQDMQIEGNRRMHEQALEMVRERAALDAELLNKRAEQEAELLNKKAALDADIEERRLLLEQKRIELAKAKAQQEQEDLHKKLEYEAALLQLQSDRLALENAAKDGRSSSSRKRKAKSEKQLQHVAVPLRRSTRRRVTRGTQ